MKRNVSSAMRVCCGLAVTVGIFGLPTRAAFASDVPTTRPTITAPTGGNVVSGVVVLTATSTAPMVQFLVFDTPIGTPVAVIDGIATGSWTTWGLPNDNVFAPSALMAEDCNDAGCGPLGGGVDVIVSNPAPVLTAPIDGSTTGTLPELSATVPGGSVQFLVDQLPIGVDTTAPYDVTPPTPLSAGQHTVSARSCNVSGTRCDGPSASEQITVAHPTITAVTPSPFSPNGDGRDDTTRVTFSLPDPESASWTITDSQDAVIQGPNPLGALSAGSHSFDWSGQDNSQTRVADGKYTVTLSTTTTVNGVQFTGSATTSVAVDTTSPTLGVPSGRNVVFYPVHDGYRDTFTSKVSINEAGSLSLTIATLTGHIVRVLHTTNAAPGAFSLSWDGKNAAGHLVPAGTYHFHWAAQDVAGNRTTGATYNVVVSLRYLVTKTATITEHGSADKAFTGTASCATASKSQSVFKPYGLVLINGCSMTHYQLVVALYAFTVPAAIVYSHIQLYTYGLAHAPPILMTSLILNYSTGGPQFINNDLKVSTKTRVWTNIGGISGSHHVSDRTVVISVGLANTPHARYDIGNVRIVVTYKVLS
jgi:flagellar hook assembly protein FlgD